VHVWGKHPAVSDIFRIRNCCYRAAMYYHGEVNRSMCTCNDVLYDNAAMVEKISIQIQMKNKIKNILNKIHVSEPIWKTNEKKIKKLFPSAVVQCCRRCVNCVRKSFTSNPYNIFITIAVEPLAYVRKWQTAFIFSF
jgi:hypothetical protein